MKRFDAIVIGVGGIGSAALHAFARRGLSVLGIEQFQLAHDRGSTHGETRLIRRAYFEHPDYVPLVDRAFAAWAELESDAGVQFFYRSGLFLAGPPEGAMIRGTRLAAATHNLQIDPLSADDCHRKFPLLRPSADMDVLFEADAGFLRVEECVRTYVRLAERHGAETLWDTPVRSWRKEGTGFEVDAGTKFRCDRLVVCGGAWAGRLLADLRLPFVVRRKPVVWHAVADERFRFDHGFPVFGFDVKGDFLYGFPSQDGRTLKVANHSGGDVADPDQLDRDLHRQDYSDIEAFVSTYLHGVEKRVVRHSVCIYTMTPDEHFIVDRHPEIPNLAFVAGLSGHGFKFAPVLGAAVADLACGIDPPSSFDFLRMNRPSLMAHLKNPHPALSLRKGEG